MRVGLLGPFPPFRGGIAQFDFELGLNLAQKASTGFFGYTRLYPQWLFPGKFQRDEAGDGLSLPVSPVFHPFRPSAWPRGRRLLSNGGLDALFVSVWTPFFAPALTRFLGPLRRRGVKRIVALCHNVLPHERFPLGAWLQRRLLKRMDGCVAHWAGDKALLEKWFPQKPSCTLFVPRFEHFPDTGLSREAARERLGLAKTGRKILLFFGMIRHYKGLDTLLQAFALLAKTDPNLFLLVAGESYERPDAYQALLGPLVAAGRATLTNEFVKNDQVEYYFKAADVVVLPYRSATQSGVVPLAYQWGRGVVTTRVGGLAEVVEDGVSGLLVSPEAPEELAAGVQVYLAAQARFEAGIPGVAVRCSVDEYARRLFDFTVSLAPGGKPGAGRREAETTSADGEVQG